MDDFTRNTEPEAVETGQSILVVGPRADELARIAQALRAQRVAVTITTREGGTAQVAGAVARARPNLLLVSMSEADNQTLDEIDRIEHLYPAMKTVLVCDDHTPEFLKRAMRAGVREVLAVDIGLDALCSVVARVLNKRPSEPLREGKVLAFMSCNGGGSGATFVATNLAHALATAHDKKVIVLDLNLQWGDAALFISHKRPVTTLAEVVAQIERVDVDFLSSSLLSVNPNLGVLAAPEDPVQALDIKPEHIDLLLRIARSAWDFVILDIGGVLDAVTVRAMDHADVIYPVMQVSVPYIRDANSLFKAFAALGYPPEKTRLLVNRFQKGGSIQLADLEQTLGTSVHQTLPNDYAAVTDSINQGTPVLELTPNSAIARGLQQLAQSLLPDHGVPTRSWMSRLLHRA